MLKWQQQQHHPHTKQQHQQHHHHHQEQQQQKDPPEDSTVPSADATSTDQLTAHVPGGDDCGGRVPVWVQSRVCWVTGVGRRTTCDDVLGALGADPATYVIAERWGRVERRLDGKARLLRVWRAWGDAQGQVRLILRRSDESPPSSRRRPHHHHHHPHTVRRLMRLILEQGETISEQLRRLGERDSQIENLEQRTHRERVKALGSNYLVDSYLGEDSGVVSDLTPAATPQDEDEDNFADESDDAASQHDTSPESVAEQVELLERVVRLNRRLEREESALVKLTLQIRSLQQQAPPPDSKQGLLERLDAASRRLEEGAAELESNAQALSQADALLATRRHHLQLLQGQLDQADCATTVVDQGDSNSDTGLSSLHSGSDEAVCYAYTLDTLV